jgi:hypothetical protein
MMIASPVKARADSEPRSRVDAPKVTDHIRRDLLGEAFREQHITLAMGKQPAGPAWCRETSLR